MEYVFKRFILVVLRSGLDAGIGMQGRKEGKGKKEKKRGGKPSLQNLSLDPSENKTDEIESETSR